MNVNVNVNVNVICVVRCEKGHKYLTLRAVLPLCSLKTQTTSFAQAAQAAELQMKRVAKQQVSTRFRTRLNTLARW